MAEVKILVKGFIPTGGRCGTTISLIRDKDILIVSDPGVVKNQKVIIDALKKENLTINDITHVFITHSHIDHYRNIGMFPDAKTIEYYGIWEEDKDGVDWKEDFTDNIKIIKIPGHNYTSLALSVKTDKGIVMVVGDLFWKENYPEDDPYADEPEKLKETRKQILKMADYIIPGHGDMFKVKK